MDEKGKPRVSRVCTCCRNILRVGKNEEYGEEEEGPGWDGELAERSKIL